MPVVLPYLTAERATLMADELAFQQHLAETPAYRALPRGAIHGDLFRDNVMFEGEVLSGLFDFYFAGVDTLLFDIAVCLNDWCIDLDTGRLVEERATAFVAAYDRVRRLESTELRLMPALMRAAALRFRLPDGDCIGAPTSVTMRSCSSLCVSAYPSAGLARSPRPM